MGRFFSARHAYSIPSLCLRIMLDDEEFSLRPLGLRWVPRVGRLWWGYNRGAGRVGGI